MAAEDTPLVAARRERLASWIADNFNGQQSAFIAHIPDEKSRVNQGLLSGLISGSKSFGEKQAAKLERMYQMPAGHLVKALDPALPSQPLIPDLGILVWAETVVRAKESERKARFGADEHAKELLEAYLMFVKWGGAIPPSAAESFTTAGSEKSGDAKGKRGQRSRQ